MIYSYTIVGLHLEIFKNDIVCWSDNNSEDKECENGLYIEFLIEDSSTGKFPFCDMYEIRQNRIVDSRTDEEHPG